MKTTHKTDTITFTSRGRIVVPRWLRKEFEIEKGTRALVYQQEDRIVIKPMTAKRYDVLQGCLKGTDAMKVFVEERKRERELSRGHKGSR